MTNNNAVCSRVLQGVFLAVLLAAFGLAACRSGGGGSTTSDTNTTTPPATLTTYTITASTGTNGTVTPSGATTVTQGASQSYTITPNGGYAIATLVIDGTTVANSSTHTFTNVQANHTISATFSAVSAGGIVLSLVPVRTSGVAPLAVFFDASGTTDIGVTTRPFHELEYTWNFGDTNAGVWNAGAQPGTSKNSATGPVAAHVFEIPGTYTVTLTAYDGVNTNTTTTTITVQDPDTIFAGTNTICVSSNTTPTAGANGCPAGAQTVMQSNFATAVNTYALTNRRVLFKRGDTFSAPTSAAVTSTGPGTIGAYGTITDPKPVVQMTGNAAILNLSSGTTHNIKDWRIMDLDFDVLDRSGTVGIDTAGGIKQVLVLNMNIHNINEGVKFNDGVLNWFYYHGYPTITMFDEMAVVDSTISGYPGLTADSRMFVSANRFSIQGNMIGNELTTMGNHVLRVPYMGKGVISNNTIARAFSTGHAIKLHGPAWCDPTSPIGTCISPETGGQTAAYNYTVNTRPIGIFATTSGYTEQVIISDNKIVGASNAWTVGLGPQSANHDERLKDIIIERNWFTSGVGTNVALLAWTIETTIRNNICDMTGANSHTCVSVVQRGEEPPPNHVRVYNNTLYSGSAGDFYGVDIGSTATNVSVINNLGSAPLATGPIMINGTGTSGLVQSNNSTPAQMKNTFPGWISATPAVPADFGITAGSYANNTGASVPVWSDFFRTSRPQNGVIDIGAVEGP